MFSPQATALLTLIRNEIQRYGQSVVDCEKLLVFVSKSDPIGVQFGHIFGMTE
jgi:phosphoenolpyruvate carboxylase